MTSHLKKIGQCTFFVFLLLLGAAQAENEHVDKWLQQVKAGDAVKAQQANQDLMNEARKDEEITSLLADYLEDEAAVVRSNAAFVIGETGNGEHAQLLVSRTQKDEDVTVRRNLALALLKVGDFANSVPESLNAVYTSEKDPETKLYLAASLLVAGDESATQEMKQAFTTKELQDACNKIFAAYSQKQDVWGGLDISQRINYVKELSSTLNNTELANNIHKLLQGISQQNKAYSSDMKILAQEWENWCKTEQEKQRVDQLFADLTSDDSEKVSQAVEELRKQGEKLFSRILQEAKSENIAVQENSVTILASFDYSQAPYQQHKNTATALFRELLTSENSTVLSEAATALGKLQVKAATPEIVKLLDNNSLEVRLAAIQSLDQLEVSDLSLKLLEMLDSEESFVIKTAIYASLAKNGSLETLQKALNKLSQDNLREENEDFLKAVAECAAKANATSLLEKLLDSDYSNVRFHAAKQLKVNTNNANLFIPLLADENLEVRKLAFEGLKQVANTSFGYDVNQNILDRLHTIGRWEQWWTVQKAIQAFEAGDEKKCQETSANLAQEGKGVLQHLYSSYENCSTKQKQWVLKTLSAFQTPGAFQFVAGALQSSNAEIQNTAVDSLFAMWTNLRDVAILSAVKDFFAGKASEEQKLSIAIKLSGLEQQEGQQYIKALLKEEAKVSGTLAKLPHDVFHKLGYEELATHVKAKNSVASEVISFLLKSEDTEAWDVLLENYASLSSEQKTSLIATVGKNHLTAVKTLVSKVKEEKDEKAFVALCNLIDRQDNNEYNPLLLEVLSDSLTVPSKKAVTKAIHPALSAEQLDNLFKFYQAEKDTQVKDDVLAKLAEVKEEKVKKFFEAELQTENTQRIKAGLYFASEFPEVLIAQLSKEKDVQVRLIWLDGLKLQDKQAKDFAEYLKSEQDQKVFSAGLKKLAKQKAVDALLSLYKDKDAAAKKEVVGHLQQQSGKAQYATLEKLYGEEKDTALQQSLLEVMAQWDAEKTAALVEKQVASRACSLASFQVLVKCSAKTARNQLGNFVSQLATPEAKLEAVKALQGQFSVSNADILITLLGSENADVRANANETLQKISGKQNSHSLADAEGQKKSTEYWTTWHSDYVGVKQQIQGLLQADAAKVDEIRKQILSNTNVPVWDFLFSALQDAATEKERVILIDTILQKEDPRRTELCQSLLGSPDAQVRVRVYSYLGKAGNAEFLQQVPVLYVMESSVLGKITLLPWAQKQAPSIVDMGVITAFLQSQSADAWESVVVACEQGHLKPTLLLENLAKVSSEDLQKRILKLVVASEDERTVVELAKIFQSAESVRAAVLQSLKKSQIVPGEACENAEAFGEWWKKSQSELQSKAQIRTWIAQLDTTDIVLKQQASHNLQTSEKAYPVLLEVVGNKKRSLSDRVNALEVLARSAKKQDVALYESLLKEDAALRRLAAQALAKVGYTDATEAIEKSLKNEDPYVRFFAVQALGKNKSEATKAALLSMLKDSDSRVREEAYYWVDVNDFDTLTSNLDGLKDEAPAVQEIALKNLSGYKDQVDQKTVVPMLLVLLSSPFEEVRSAAYNSLKDLTGQNIKYDPANPGATDEAQMKTAEEERKKAIEEWSSWWSESAKKHTWNEWVSRFANPDADAESIRKLLVETPGIYNTLRNHLKDPRGVVRVNVVKTIGALNNKSAAIDLVEHLGDADVRVREAVLAALKTLSTQKVELALPESQWPTVSAKLKEWWAQQKDKEKAKLEEQQQQLKDKVKELTAQFANKDNDSAKTVQSLKDLGAGAVEHLLPYLKDKNPAIALGTAKALGELNAKQATDAVMGLVLSCDAQEVLKVLEKLTGNKFSWKASEELQQQQFVKDAGEWWKKYNESLETKLSEKVEALLATLEKESEADVAKKLSNLGPAAKNVIKQYLEATKDVKAKRAITLSYNSLAGATALNERLNSEDPSLRKFMLSAINVLTGQNFEIKEDASAEEWKALSGKVTSWLAENLPKQADKAAKSVASAESDLASAEKREAKAKQLAESSPLVREHLEALLSKTEPKLGALLALKKLNDVRSVGKILPLLSDADKDVRQAASETIEALSGEKLPAKISAEEVVEEQLVAMRKDWSQKQQQALDKTIDTQALKNMLLQWNNNEVKEQDVKQYVEKDVAASLQKLSNFSQDNNDHLRLASLQAIGLVANYNHANLLLDRLGDHNVKVRKALYDGLQKLSSDKLPVEYPEDKWQDTVAKWKPEWEKKERDAQTTEVLADLKVSAKKIENFGQLWVLDQVKAARKALSLLENPIKEVRESAWKALEKSAGDLVFDPERPTSEQEKTLQDLQRWLDTVEKDIMSDVEGSKDELEQLKKQLATTSGIYTEDDYEALKDTINSMMNHESPTIQEAYLAILDKFGCDVSKFNVYAPRSARQEYLYGILDRQYERMQDLKTLARKAEGVEDELEKAFSIEDLNTLDNLKLVDQLIAALDNEFFPLRKKIAAKLTALAGDDNGYDPGSSAEDRNKAIEEWKNWSKETAKEIEEKAKQQVEKVLALVKSFENKKTLETAEDVANARLLVDALSSQQREDALKTLKSLNADKELPDTKAWKNWLNEVEQNIGAMNQLKQRADRVKNFAKVNESSQVKAIGELVALLKDKSQEKREIAFAALSEYVRKHAQNQVREDFGYDPKAPEQLLNEKAAEWQKWFTEHVQPLAKEEEQKLTTIANHEKMLQQDKITTSKGWRAAQELVNYLKGDKLSVRRKALDVLKTHAKTDYNFDTEVSPETQKNALDSWNWWLQSKKNTIVKNMHNSYQDKNLDPALWRATAGNFMFILEAPESLPELRELAASWFRIQSGENFGFSTASAEDKQKQALEKIQAWWKKNDALYHIQELASELSEGILDAGDVESVRQIAHYLKSEDAAAVKSAQATLNRVAKQDFDFSKTTEKEINSWLKEIEKLQELVNDNKMLEEKADLLNHFDELRDLVEALSNPAPTVRQYAIHILNQLSKEPFAYQYNATKEQRDKDLVEIKAWLEKFE